MRRKFDPSRKGLLDSEERRKSFPPEKILSLLPLSPEQTVADIGCGTGYFTIPLSERLTGGKIYAIDISEDMLSGLRKKLEKLPENNIVVLKTEDEKIPLTEASLDGAMLICVLHEAAQDRAAFLNKVFGLLKPGGWLAVVEWNKKEMPEGPPVQERIDIGETLEMAPRKGVTLLRKKTLGEKHYFLLWRKETNEQRTGGK